MYVCIYLHLHMFCGNICKGLGVQAFALQLLFQGSLLVVVVSTVAGVVLTRVHGWGQGFGSKGLGSNATVNPSCMHAKKSHVFLVPQSLLRNHASSNLRQMV